MDVRAKLVLILGTLLLALSTNVGICQTPSSQTGSEDTSDTHAINWGWALTVAGDYTASLGTYYIGVEPGIGMDARIARSISRHVALHVSYCHYGLHVENPTEFLIYRSVDGKAVGRRLMDDIYTLTVGVEYQRWIDRRRRNHIKAYFSLDIGVARHTTSGYATIWLNRVVMDPVITYPVAEDDDHAMLSTGSGLIFPVGGKFQIDTGAHVDLVWVEEDNSKIFRQYVSGDMMYVFRLTAGLTWTI
jgi:hypothetical protein